MATNSQSILLPIEGEFPVDPEIRLQPTVQRAAPTATVGWKWRRRYTITNNASEPIANFPHAIDLGLTNGLVTAGMAQADGDDLRVWFQGLEIARTLTDWNSGTFTTLCWIVIPYLAVGGSMTVDVVYGNSAATAPPTLTAGTDLPAFDIAVAGANRSTNAKWVYLVDRTVANAGKGGWYLSTGTAQPDVRHSVPGAWQPVNTLQSDDDRKQESYSTYVATGTKYQGRFEARRASPGALLVGQDNGMDGVAIRLPIGITAVRSDIRWTNLAIGDTDLTPIGQVVIVTRNQPSESWKTLYSNTALQATEATIATATYTPAASVKEVAYAVWPQSGNNIDLGAKPDRYINGGWFAVLEVHPTSGNVVTALTSETALWTPTLLTTMLKGWWRADNIAGLIDGAAISSVSDLSGNGRTLTSAGANQPTYQTDELNHSPVMRFDGVDDELTIANALGIAAQPFAIYAVWKPANANTQALAAFEGGATDPLAWINTSGALETHAGTALNMAVTKGGWLMTGHVFNGASSLVLLNGITGFVAGNAGAAVPNATEFKLGRAANDTAPLNGDISEVIVINADVVSAVEHQIFGYFAWRYGLTAQLDAASPYKTTPPTASASEIEIYELATELRHGGGGGAVGVPPYKSIFLGNAKSASGVGTPRLACQLLQHIAVKTADRRVEVWNSGLTAKVEDAPIPAHRAVDGVLDDTGATVEQASADWMPLMPAVNPLTNPSADVNVTDWTAPGGTAGVTTAFSRVTSTFDSSPGSFRLNVTANSAGANAFVDVIATDYLPIGNRDSVWLGMAVRVSEPDIVPRQRIYWYDAAQVLLSGNDSGEDLWGAAFDTWYRRLFAAAVPDGAVYYRVGTRLLIVTAGDLGDAYFDTVAVNDTEIALIDVATGTIVLSAEWTPRYAYA